MIVWTHQNSTGFTLSELALINAVKTDLVAEGHLDGHADTLLETALEGRHSPRGLWTLGGCGATLGSSALM